jgi:hypothetical protein
LSDSWDLGEFFEALGPVMRLPPKEEEEDEARMPSARSARRTRWLVVLALVLVLGVAGAGPLWRALRPSLPVPAGLIGTWTASADRYAGRSFELSATTLDLRPGGQPAVYPIVELRRRDSSSAHAYTLRYQDGSSTLEFGFAIGPDSLVRLRNLPGVEWKKARP